MALASVLEDSVVRELDSAYYGTEWHCISLGALFEQLKSDPERGLGLEEARSRLEARGLNLVPSPQDCPAWLCCLLPWLKNTPSMVSYRQCTPESANLVRDGKRMCVDPFALVPGDLVTVEAGELLPADCRVVRCSSNFAYSAFDLAETCLYAVETEGDFRQSFVQSRNMVYYGCTVVSGSASCVVVATGKDTVMAALIQRKHWPVDNVAKPLEEQHLLPI